MTVGLSNSRIIEASDCRHTILSDKNRLAATLRGSRPGVQSASPETPKNTSFIGVTQPPGVAQPLYSRGHN